MDLQLTLLPKNQNKMPQYYDKCICGIKSNVYYENRLRYYISF